MRFHRVAGLLPVMLLTLQATEARAADANDAFAAAVPLTQGVEVPFDARGFTNEAGEAPVDCTNPGSMWWSLSPTAPASGEYAAYVTDVATDTRISWHVDLATEVASTCVDDSDGSYGGVTSIGILSGTTRYVRVSAYADSIGGVGSVGVVEAHVAADDFAAAQPLTFAAPAAPSAVAGVALQATETSQVGEPTACGSIVYTQTAWLSFVPPEDGSWMIESKFPDANALAVYTGPSVSDLTLVGCNANTRRAVIQHLDAGTTYWIQVAGLPGAPAQTGIVRAERSALRQVSQLVAAAGTAGGLGEYSDLVLLPDGRPAIAYSDGVNGDLRYAERSTSGTWTDVLVDAEGGAHASTEVGIGASLEIVAGQPAIAYVEAGPGGDLRYAQRDAAGTWSTETILADDSPDNWLWLTVLADGRPAISYGHRTDVTHAVLKLATRNADGSWTGQVVDADGAGASTDVGAYSVAHVLRDGSLGILYDDYTEGSVRFAHSASGGSAPWTDELVDGDGDGPTTDTSSYPDFVQDPATGALYVGYYDGDAGSIRFAQRAETGGAWSDQLVTGERDLNEVGYGPLRVALDSTGGPAIVWAGYGQGGTIAVSTRAPSGVWTTADAVPWLSDPHTDGSGGSYAADGAIGLVVLPDARFAVSTGDLYGGDLFYLEDALDSDAGARYQGNAGSPIALAGAASDALGTVVATAWQAPPGCTVANPGALSTSMTCTSGWHGAQVGLLATDEDGLTHRATATVNVCPSPTTPFTDIAGSFAATQIACIYGLAITAGIDATHYGPTVTVTREQMAVFLAKLYESATGAPAPAGSTPFTDIGGSFAATAIAQIYGLGITAGVDATHYGPGSVVTREQMAVFLAKLYKAITGTDATTATTPFTDVGASFAVTAIGQIYGLGITAGVDATHYAPANPVARDQMAVFLARLFLAS